MAVRIYAFAKELGLENSELLDICTKAGIAGKGSALASLDDEEIAKIKDFMSSSAGTAAPVKEVEPLAPPAPEPPKTLGTNKLRNLTPRKRPPVPAPSAELTQPAEPATPPEPAAEESVPAAAEAAPTTSTPPPVPKPSSPLPPVPKPGGVPARKSPLREIGSRSRKTTGDKSDRKDSRRRSPLVANIAAMPEVKQPAPGDGRTGEKVQKPDIALPQDAIRNAQKGKTAPLEQFTRQTKERDQKKVKRPGQKGESEVLGEMPSTGRRSGARRKRTEGEVDADLGSTRQKRSRRPRLRGREEGGPGSFRRRRSRSGPVVNTAAPRKDDVVLQLPCTIREFSEAAGIPAVQVLLTLRKLGDEVNRNINSDLEEEYVDVLLDQFEIDHVEVRAAESLEDQLLGDLEEAPDDPDKLVPRPPIVTFLGHVDHGKTSLLDAIIGIDVVSGEAGGITQHIRAYEVNKGDQKIAFVDTPGHEAFTEMRARGANVTDIAVLVVAADDGVMPQTEEAISHAKAAGVPIVVALNKIDLPGANPDKALQDLAAHELLPSEWGGDVEVVRTSATNGTGLDELLETILVTAELHEYRADPDRPAIGTCLEAEQQSGKGVVAKFIVQNGTLRVGDVVVCGGAHGRVKAMYDTLRPSHQLEEAGPSTPVNLTGLDVTPDAGDRFHVLDDISQARAIAETREHRSRQQSLSGITTRISLEEIQARLESGDLADPNRDVITLNLIIRADVRGSIEAIEKEISKISHPEIRIKILQALVGGVTVADVRLAQASEAIIIGFNVVPDEAARSLAEELQVEIRRYGVIYKITDDLKATLEGKLKPEEHVVEQGMAMVLQTFNISRTGTIAGCRVMRGNIQRDCRIRVIRDSRIIGDYGIGSLKRVKEDAKEVQRGMECGIRLDGFNDVKEGDTLEAYKIEEVARTL